MSRLLLTALTLLSLNSCATTSPATGSPSCCLVDPGSSPVLLPDSPSSKAALEAWVTKHSSNLSTTGGAKPRFILMYVTGKYEIKHQMPLSDQASPTAPHKLSESDVNDLRACFRGGKSVKIDWANKKVIP
jgi:hypothetical protein